MHGYAYHLESSENIPDLYTAIHIPYDLCSFSYNLFWGLKTSVEVHSPLMSCVYLIQPNQSYSDLSKKMHVSYNIYSGSQTSAEVCKHL